MKICVVGTGYVGLVAGTCFAEIGNDVICMDVDENKVSGCKRESSPSMNRVFRNSFEGMYKKSVFVSPLTSPERHKIR